MTVVVGRDRRDPVKPVFTARAVGVGVRAWGIDGPIGLFCPVVRTSPASRKGHPMIPFPYETTRSRERRPGRSVQIDADSMVGAREIGTTASRLRGLA